MTIDDLCKYASATQFETDIIIVGGGAAGITLAREFANAAVRVLLLESGGVHECQSTSELNAVENIADPSGEAQVAKRKEFHQTNAPLWSHEVQPFGVRCRGLGGSTQAWAGKSSPFDPIDFSIRPWISHSGWPIDLNELAPYLARAGKSLNLGPVINDKRFWGLLGIDRKILSDDQNLRSYFWQFARSRIDAMDIMRFGPEFMREDHTNIRVLLNATVTHISAPGKSFKSVEVAGPDGIRHTVIGRVAVLATSAIENARLLLVSGLGNETGMVGRYLMDHPGCRIARITEPSAVRTVLRHFGFYALNHEGNTHMYVHGLSLTPDIQAREGLANTAAYIMEKRAPDDPWVAIKRLLRCKSERIPADIWAIVKSPTLIISGVGRKILQHRAVSPAIKKVIVDLAIRFNPGFAAAEFQHGGVPHKLTGLEIDAITEQRPDYNNYVTLSDRVDRFGVPLPKIYWRVSDASRGDLASMGHILRDEFVKAGLPAPILDEWVESRNYNDAIIIDMAHTSGTTRMSEDNNFGVVNPNCEVHGITGLYVAGASVFPTSGHANPTLMICAITIRLADHLKAQFQ